MPRNQAFPAPCIMGDESIMSPKRHGTSDVPVQSNLRWGCDERIADRICNYNRHYAEHSGYFETTTFVRDIKEEAEAIAANNAGAGAPHRPPPIRFYDSNTGNLLFVAPRGRTMEEFLAESRAHGWPSFRDSEVVWDNVRCLPGGETVSIDGTHLGHNLPDGRGSRYCINLVSIAGNPVSMER